MTTTVDPTGPIPQVREEDMPVRGETSPQSLGWRVARSYEEGTKVALTGVGPHAVNTMVKAVIIANGNMASRGIVFLLFPKFATVPNTRQEEGEGSPETLTAVTFVVVPQKVA